MTLPRSKTAERANATWAARGREVLMGNYAQQPLAPVRGEGLELIDVEGQRYLDFISGIAVSNLGHGHPALVEALQSQAAELLHVSNLYWIPNQITLAEKIVAGCFADRVLFCNSGAEANEAAVKLARRFAWNRNEPERVDIVSTLGSFHGRTLGMLAATGTAKYREGFEPLPAGFRNVPYGDIGALREAVNARTAAVLLEPVQGEGGVNVPPPGYLAAAREICDAMGALLIFDEVQIGVGRSGYLFAHQGVPLNADASENEVEEVRPDVLTLAKGLGGGVPIGAVACSEHVGGALSPGTHGTTFGGNPLACSAANAVMDVVTTEGFLDQVKARAAQLDAGLRDLVTTLPWARSTRGLGLLRGLEVEPDWQRGGVGARAIMHRCRERGLLVGIATDAILRFAPPLIVDAAAIDRCLETLASLALSEPEAAKGGE